MKNSERKKLPLDFKLDVFRKSTRFDGLSEDALIRIATLAYPRYFKRREFIFHEGDASKFFYIVQQGRVKLFKMSPTGKNFIVHVGSIGNSLNSYVLFEGKAHDLSAQAIDDATILALTREEYLSLVNDNPILVINSMNLLAKVVNSAYERIVDLIGEKVDQRLSNVLLMLYLKFGATLSFTSEEIADLCGTTTETAIRGIARLKELGVLVPTRGKIIILDEIKLRKLSQSSYML